MALVVLSSVFLALYQAFAGGARGIRQANMNAAAVEIARAKLASVGIETALRDGLDASGTEDRYTWHLSAQRYVVPADQQPQSNVAAYWVDVEVSWRDGALQSLRTVHLRKLQLGLKP